jgi:aspartate racemase
MVMQTRLYGAIASAAVVAPDGEALAEVHRNYAEMATVGRVSRAQQQAFFDAGKVLHQDRGAEVVLLAGTDLFLAFQGVDCGFPVLDCAQIHLDALCQSSLGG